jgi:CRP/FNR family nitrogen fixation transcriptional regulator
MYVVSRRDNPQSDNSEFRAGIGRGTRLIQEPRTRQETTMQAQTRTAETRFRTAPSAGHPARPDAPPRRPALSALDLLEQFGSRRTVCRGQELYAAGEPAEHCFRIVSGCVRMVGLDADGRRQIADFLFPGELCGFDALGTHHLSAEALTDAVVVVCYPRRAVDGLADRHAEVAASLRGTAMQSLRRAHGKMFLLGRKTAGERVAAFLLEMAARSPGAAGGRHVGLPMIRADIADHLGLTLETVSRTMAQLCRDGAIAAARGGIEIRDRAALEAFGTSARH